MKCNWWKVIRIQELILLQFFQTSTADVVLFYLVLNKGCLELAKTEGPQCHFYLLYSILSLTLGEDHEAKRLLDTKYFEVLEEELSRLPKTLERLSLKELTQTIQRFALLTRLMTFTDFLQLNSRKLEERVRNVLMNLEKSLKEFDKVKIQRNDQLNKGK